MRAPATISVDNDLTASGACISLRTTNDEAARGVEMEHNLVIEVLGRDDGLDDLVKELLADNVVLDIRGMLGRDDNGVDPLRNHGAMVVLVLDGDLGLGIRTEPWELARVAGNREALNELGGEHVRQGHVLRSLVSSIAEHVALVTGTNVLVLAANVDTTSDIGGLLIKGDHDVARLIVEALGAGVESNALDGIADDLLVVGVAFSSDLTKD